MKNCKQMQTMIQAFDHGMLSLKDEKNFVNHLENCADCLEEFEIYYIVSYGLSDGDLPATDEKEKKCLDAFDFKGLVKLKLEKSHANIIRCNKMHKRFVFSQIVTNLCMILAIVLFIIIKYY